MPKGRNYTQEQQQYVADNFGKIPTIEIAKTVGTSPCCIRKWVIKMRQGGYKIDNRKASVGEQRRNWCEDKKAYVVKEKLANGKWKHIRYEGHTDKKCQHIKELPVGSIRDCKNGTKRIKTEAGWRYMKKPASEKKKPGGIRTKIFKPGDKVSRKHNGKIREFIRQEDMSWKIVPLQFVSKVTRTPKASNVKSITSSRRIEKKSPNPPKKALDPTKNPDKVKIMSDAEKIAAGYRYIQIDAKTRVLRHPSKLTEEQKTA